MWFRLSIVDIDLNKLGQTYCSITFMETSVHYILGQGGINKVATWLAIYKIW
jgi:hypothetical protein